MFRDASESCQHGDEGEGVQREDPRSTEGSHQQAAESRADRAGEVEADAVERDGGGHLVPGHEILKEGLPAGEMDRGADPQKKQQDQQFHRTQLSAPGHHRHESGHGHHPELGPDQQATAVGEIGQGSSGNPKEEGGKACRRLDEADQ